MPTPNPQQFETAKLTAEQMAQQVDPMVMRSIELAEQASMLQSETNQSDIKYELGEVNRALVSADNPDRFNLSQRILENSGQWTEASRLLAQDINRLDQEQKGEFPLTFDQTVEKMKNFAEADLKSPDHTTKKEGLALDGVLRGLDRPSKDIQQESLDALLTDLEAVLTGYERSARSIGQTPGAKAEIREYRAMRDAVLTKRAEMVIVDRQEAKAKAERQSGERMARDARERVADVYRIKPDEEPDSSGDSPTNNESVSDNHEEEERAKLLAEVPNDLKGQMLFERQNFSSVATEKLPLLSAFIEKHLQRVVREQQEGSRYPSTVAGVMGSSGEARDFLQIVASKKLNGGELMDLKQFDRMPFAEVAKAVGVDVKKVVPDYEARFRV